MAQWLEVAASLPEDPAQFPAPVSGPSKLPVTPAPGDRTPSSGLRRYPQTCGMYTYKHTYNTQIKVIVF